MKRHYQPEKSTEKIVRSAFFKRDPLTCARELIGTELIWGQCSGLVVEVEAYAAIDDEAAHTFTRPSARSFIDRNKAGAAYVYFNYGVHWMLNVLVKGDANGFVLIRALEPRRGVELMKRRRGVTISVSFAPVPASSHKRLLSLDEIMRWICAAIRATASSPIHARLSMLWRTNASASAALRICRGDLRCAVVPS